MSYGKIIRSNRKRLEMTQRELAGRLGCTDGYVAHLESEFKLPSINILLALSGVFGFTVDDQQVLLEAVEKKRVQRSTERIRTRGVTERELLQIRRGGERATKINPKAEQIARDLEQNPELHSAYRDLRTALSDPKMSETVLNTLRAFAKSSHKP